MRFLGRNVPLELIFVGPSWDLIDAAALDPRDGAGDERF